MTNITPLFNSYLQPRSTHSSLHPHSQSSTTDEFLKEAYRIASHISSLKTHLLSIRQAYLSTTAPPPSRRHTKSPSTSTATSTTNKPNSPVYLTNPARDAIDTNAKLLLRDLSSSLRQLSEAESIRHATWQRIHAQKYRKGPAFRLLAQWASGGGDDDHSADTASETQRLEEGKEETLNGLRESVLWFLGRRLESVADVQREMVERRVRREVERGRSVLYMAKTGKSSGDSGGGGGGGANASGLSSAMLLDEEESRRQQDPHYNKPPPQTNSDRGKSSIDDTLTPEQQHLFAEENKDMLKHYEDTLDQVRTAEKSILEISSLQTQLVENLDLQSAHISQLVADSVTTTTNVGGGNRQLKRAAERRSTARMVFWASCGLCGVLVGWDLIF